MSPLPTYCPTSRRGYLTDPTVVAIAYGHFAGINRLCDVNMRTHTKNSDAGTTQNRVNQIALKMRECEHLPTGSMAWVALVYEEINAHYHDD